MKRSIYAALQAKHGEQKAAETHKLAMAVADGKPVKK
jgi:hypothetical protein